MNAFPKEIKIALRDRVVEFFNFFPILKTKFIYDLSLFYVVAYELNGKFILAFHGITLPKFNSVHIVIHRVSIDNLTVTTVKYLLDFMSEAIIEIGMITIMNSIHDCLVGTKLKKFDGSEKNNFIFNMSNAEFENLRKNGIIIFSK